MTHDDILDYVIETHEDLTVEGLNPWFLPVFLKLIDLTISSIFLRLSIEESLNELHETLSNYAAPTP